MYRRNFVRIWCRSTFLFVVFFRLSAGSFAVAADPDNPFATEQEKIAAAKPRTWNASNGKFSVEAKLLKVDEGKAVLKRADGQEISVPLDKLSEADQKYVDNLLGKSPATAGESSSASSSATGGDAVGDSKVVYKLTLVTTDYRTAKSVDLGVPDLGNTSPMWPLPPTNFPRCEFRSNRSTSSTGCSECCCCPKKKKRLSSFITISKRTPARCSPVTCNRGNSMRRRCLAKTKCPSTFHRMAPWCWPNSRGTKPRAAANCILYTREGNKVKPLKGWRPFTVPSGRDGDNFNTSVDWATFTDSQHVLTEGSFGKLVLWEVPSLKPVWSTYGRQRTFV